MPQINSVTCEEALLKVPFSKHKRLSWPRVEVIHEFFLFYFNVARFPGTFLGDFLLTPGEFCNPELIQGLF